MFLRENNKKEIGFNYKDLIQIEKNDKKLKYKDPVASFGKKSFYLSKSFYNNFNKFVTKYLKFYYNEINNVIVIKFVPKNGKNIYSSNLTIKNSISIHALDFYNYLDSINKKIDFTKKYIVYKATINNLGACFVIDLNKEYK